MEAGHYDCMVYLRLWSGDITGALQVATEKGELNDHLLSVAPMGKTGPGLVFGLTLTLCVTCDL